MPRTGQDRDDDVIDSLPSYDDGLCDSCTVLDLLSSLALGLDDLEASEVASCCFGLRFDNCKLHVLVC